jgi:type VI secretion system protein ImpM
VTAAGATAVGLFGKTPAERDFVRVNAGAFLRAGLDRWFQEGVEQLRSERSQLPAEPAHFLFVPAAGAAPFAGAFVPGQDAVGRIFPVIVFAALDPQPQADIPLIPLRLGSFYMASARLATAAHALTTEQLTSEIHTLASDPWPPATPGGVDAGLLRSSSSDLRVAVGGSPEAAAYALSTLIAACSQTKARPPESPARVLVLDCPAPTAELRTFWLELVRRHLNAKAQVPSFLWTEASGRLLVGLGVASSLMLAYLADPDHKSSRRWPLCTSNQNARVGAAEKLSSAQRQVLAAEDASLTDIVATFSDA